jgi:hypothetical protein
MNILDPSNLLPELEYMDDSAVTLDTTIPTSDTYLRQALLEVHDFKCFYSSDPITADTFHIEHIHPRSLG